MIGQGLGLVNGKGSQERAVGGGGEGDREGLIVILDSGKKRELTFSKSIARIAPSIPRTTPAMLPVTCLIVTAV